MFIATLPNAGATLSPVEIATHVKRAKLGVGLKQNEQLLYEAYVGNHASAAIKLQHYYSGVRVEGSMLHIRFVGEIRKRDDTDSLARFDLKAEPTLTPAQATAIAQAELGQPIAASPELVIWPDQVDRGQARLVYFVHLTAPEKAALLARDIVLDAHTGEVLAEVPHILTLAPIDVYSAEGSGIRTDRKTGTPAPFKLSQVQKVISNSKTVGRADPSAQRALTNARRTLEYFLNTHGRDSYDGNKAPLVSVVHAGRKWPNAGWVKKQKIMLYGDGDGRKLRDLTLAVDVAGHELTHGVVGETAKLLMVGQPGALNEGYADIFGEIIENKKDWVLGRDAFLDPRKGRDGIRNIQEPERLKLTFVDPKGRRVSEPYPRHYNQTFRGRAKCTLANDFCWMHINSTLISHSYYLVEKSIGRKKAAHIYYLTLTQYLTSRSGFNDYRKKTVDACLANYPDFIDDTCEKVRAALAKTGL